MFRDFGGQQISALEFVNNPLKLIAVLYFFHISHCGFVMKYKGQNENYKSAEKGILLTFDPLYMGSENLKIPIKNRNFKVVLP